MVTIQSAGEGTCAWCRQASEGLQAKFQDGLQGFFCWKDFRAAVKARSETKEATTSAEGQASRKSA